MIWRTLCLLLAFVAPWARADLDSGSTAYTWQNGIFRVPLEVRDNSGVARRAWPVTTGVPLPVGVVRDVASLRLIDEQGREVPCQIAELNRYYARGGSPRYVLLDFQIDVPANGRVIVRLTNDRPAAAIADPINLAGDGGNYRVDTGTLTAVIDKRNPALLKSVSVGGKLVLESAPDSTPGLRTGETRVMEHHKGPLWNTHGWERQTTDESVYVAEADYRGAALQEVEVETQGPLRTVFVTRGTFRSTATGRGILPQLYHYTTRVTFYRGHSFVKVEHDVENSARSQPQWMYLLREATVNYRVRLDGPVTYAAGGRALGGGAEVAGGGVLPDNATAWLYQARPATNLKSGRYSGEEGGFVAGIGSQGVVDKPSVSGGRGRFLDVSDRDKGVMVAIRYMWEEAPRSIAASRDRIVVALNADSPGRSAPPEVTRARYDLDFGERNVNDVLLYFHEGSATQARSGDIAEAFEYPLFAYAAPAWYADAGAWYYELSRMPPERKPEADAHWRPDRVGTVGHGENASYNSGGHHDSQTSGWLPYIRSGSLGELERQLAYSRWSIAHNPGWAYRNNRLAFGTGDDRYAGLDRALVEWNRLTAFGPKDFYLWKGDPADTPRAARAKAKPPRNGGFSYFNGYKILPDIEHYALFRLFEYYNLTGDPRALDAIHGFVAWAVNFQNRHLFNGKTQPLEVTDYFERDPQALYRGHYSRIYAWMQFTTLAGFQTTGSPVFDEYARWQIRRTLALLRDRHGQLTRIGTGGDDLVELLTAAKTSEGVPRSRTQSWMESINVAGLHEAYKTYDDERILDGIWGQADYFAHHVPWYPKLGMLNNWTAMPNDLLTGGGEERARRLTPTGHDWHTLAWPLLYHYTGWSDIRERYLRSEEARVGAYVAPYFLQTGLWLTQNPKRSVNAPEAVKDLKVVNADRSGIAIEWTSPKDDGPSGRAARYFVKISDKPIVEFAPTDDPARGAAKRRVIADAETAALATGKQRWRRSPSFTATEIQGETSGARKENPDWYKVNAFWMAEHVAGEPTPGAAGTRERMTITELRPHNAFGASRQPGLEILKPGTYYVALCSWDDDHNLSPLSNVASFTLR